MRPTKPRWWAGLLIVTLVVMGVTAMGRSARAQDENAAGDTPWLGVVTQELTRELKDAMEIEGDGVLVSRVVEGSPADRAGIEKGDVIASVNSRTVRSPDDLARMVRDGRVGQEISLEVFRRGRSRTVNATLGTRPGSMEETPPAVGGERERGSEDRDQVERGRDQTERDQDRSDRDENRTREFQFDMPNQERMPMMMGRGRLGVRVQAAGPRDRVSRGARITEVVDGSAAEEAGLRAGDVITKLDDQDVNGPEDLISAVRGADRHATITFVRRGVTRTTEVDLNEAGPAAPELFRRYHLDEAPGTDNDRRVIVRRNLSEDDTAALRREIRELRRQVEELRRQVEELQRR